LLEDYNLIKFLIVFSLIIGTLLVIYVYINKVGPLPIQNKKRNIEIIEIRPISKDKGFILTKIKQKTYFFSFDSSGIKLIEKFEEPVDEKQNSSNNC